MKPGTTLAAVVIAAASTAAPRFCAGAELSYGLAVYNATLREDGRPRLQAQIRLARDGKLLYSDPGPAVEAPTRLETGQKNVSAFAVGGSFRLPPSVATGGYVFEIVVRDTLARKEATARASLDFEVMP